MTENTKIKSSLFTMNVDAYSNNGDVKILIEELGKGLWAIQEIAMKLDPQYKINGFANITDKEGLMIVSTKFGKNS